MIKEIRVGIIDDDDNKVTSIETKLKYPTFTSENRQDLYSNYKIIPEIVEIKPTLEDMIIELSENHFYEVLLIDYKLSSLASAGYNGVDLANEISNWKSFQPIFLLTSFEDELYSNEVFPSYQVFNIERFLNDKNEQEEIFMKIVKQYEYIIEKKKLWTEELLVLKKIPDKNSEQLSREIELDNWIESTVSKKSKLNTVQKLDLETNKLESLIEKIEKLMDYEEE